MKRPFQIFLIAAAVLLIYYPAQISGYFPIDDQPTFEIMTGVTGAQILQAFKPVKTVVGYYRPLIMISYVVDKALFNLDPGFMHIENVFLHLINAVLVFSIVYRLIPPIKRHRTYTPLLAGILFAIHPLATESVNWISGRTDVLASFFILGSTLLLLRYRENGHFPYLLASSGAFIAGALTKEFAVAYLPAAVLIYSSDATFDGSVRTTVLSETIRRHRNNIVVAMFAVITLIAVFLLQHPFIFSLPRRLQLTLMAASSNPLHSLIVVLNAFGFYIKKVIFPYPLNFSILEIDPLYVFPGVPVFLFALYCGRQKTMHAAFFVSGLLLLLPSLLIVFGQVAWTPYAERYLYLPLAFMIISLMVLTANSVKSSMLPSAKIVTAVFFLLLAIITVQRNIVWSDATALAADTVGKSPRSRDMRITYGLLLAQKGDYQGALEQIRVARQLPLIQYDEKADVMLAHVLDMMGRTDEALSVSLETLRRSQGVSVNALKNIISLIDDKLKNKASQTTKRRLVADFEAYSKKLYELTHDPHVLYRAGVRAEEVGDRTTARQLFLHALDNLNGDDIYRKVCERRLADLAKDGHSQSK